MRAYLTPNCYWDCDEKNIYKNHEIVGITEYQRNIMTKLIENYGKFVSHEELYFSMTGQEPIGDYKKALSDQINRKKTNQTGLYQKVPELQFLIQNSKKQIGGGYGIFINAESFKDNVEGDNLRKPVYEIPWYTNEDFYNWDIQYGSLNDNNKYIKAFLEGGRCTWPLLFLPNHYKPVQRKIVSNIIGRVLEEGDSIILSGAGGEGKTTLLMQTCVELFRQGKKVYYHKASNKFDLPEVIDSDAIFFIDNPTGSREIVNCLQRLTTEGIAVVMAVRSNEWNMIKDYYKTDVIRNFSEVSIPRLDLDEANQFAELIANVFSSNSLSIDKLSEIFYKDSYGFLYASMLMAIYDTDSLESITYEILKGVRNNEDSSNLLKLLAAIVLFERVNIIVTSWEYKYLCGRFDISDSDVKQYLKQELCFNGNKVQTRHKAISDLFYKYIFQEGNWKRLVTIEEINDIVQCVCDFYLKQIDSDTGEKQYNNTFKSSCVHIFSLGLLTLDEENRDYLLQRIVETCKTYYLNIISDITKRMDMHYVLKDLIPECCLRNGVSNCRTYKKWINRLYLQDQERAFNICKELCLEMEAPIDVWNLWGELEEKSNNIGEREIEGSAYWIYYNAYLKYPDIEESVLKLIRFWEEHLDEIEDSKQEIERFIKEECLKGYSYNLWKKWIKIEEEKGNIGNYNTFGSVLWICKEMCQKRFFKTDGSIWIVWAEMVEKYPSYCEGDTALSILKEGCIAHNAEGAVWHKWAQKSLMENMYGSPDIEDSCAWILRKACLDNSYKNNMALWNARIKYAEEYEGINSAIDILKNACIEQKVEEADLWIRWAEKNIAIDNVGNFDIVDSAAWIYKKAYESNIQNKYQVVCKFGQFIYRYHEVLDSRYNAIEILKRECLFDYDSHPMLWLTWGNILFSMKKIGDYDKIYSAAWVFKESCIHDGKTAKYNYLAWAYFADKYPMTDSSGSYINKDYVIELSKYYLDECITEEDWGKYLDYRNS